MRAVLPLPGTEGTGLRAESIKAPARRLLQMPGEERDWLTRQVVTSRNIRSCPFNP